MKTVIKFFLVLFLSLIQLETYAQSEFNKIFFPKNKDAQWLMKQWNLDSNVKTLKKFNKKFDGKNDLDSYNYNYQATKDKIFIKLNSLEGKDGTARYEGLYIERTDWNYPKVTFAGSTSKSVVKKNLSKYKEIEIVEDSDKKIAMIYHPMKVFVEVNFHKTDARGIYSIRVSKSRLKTYFENLETKKVFDSTDKRFDKNNIVINPEDIRIIKEYDKRYQIINMLYEGELVNNVPHGEGDWALFEGEVFPDRFYGSPVYFRGSGQFENGKPVGEHEVYDGDLKIYTYENGKIKKIKVKDGKYSETYNDDGVIIKVAGMPVWYGGKRLLYYGNVDKYKKPHDDAGVIYFDSNSKVMAEFEHGIPKKNANAFYTFIYDDVVLTSFINEKLQMTGKVKIEGKKNGNEYEGIVYYTDGDPDNTKKGQLKFKKIELFKGVKSEIQIDGYIKMIDFGKGQFEGEDLDFFSINYPDIKFKGGLEYTHNNLKPSGVHTKTIYSNGIAKEVLNGKYSPKGSFIEGENFYNRNKSIIYDSGIYTDSRNGKDYMYATYFTTNGGYLTWMLEDIYLESLTNEIWNYTNNNGIRVKKAYYSKTKSKYVCPSGWRLPKWNEVNAIRKLNTQDNKSVTSNIKLISFLSLERNGYVWQAYRENRLRNSGDDINFWLDSGEYVSITSLNRGTSTSLDSEKRYHTCRCVKDGKVE